MFDVGLSGLPASASDVRREGLRVADEGRVRPHRERAAPAHETLDLGETVSADLRLLRGGTTLARRQVAALKAGTRRPTLLLAKKVAAGTRSSG